jgi:cation diffusion facilitator CzcD-associated flavoprotein CzcO
VTDEGKIGVIGAGPCGLAACKALGEFGLEYECLEAGQRVGGVWNLEGHSSGAYRSLHTNTSTRAMAYADFPFGDSYPTYPSAARLQQYFEEYATHFDLRPNIHLGRRVAEAHPLDGGGWRVVEEEGGEVREYSALIVATGQYASPRWPTPAVPGDFAGEELHVFDYFDPMTPVDCRNKRVVVVGLGSSAAELAVELSDPDSDIGAAERVLLAARSGRWVVPKMIDGEPIDHKAAHPADPLPEEVVALSPDARLALVHRLLKAGFQGIVERAGTPESLGLPRPEIEPWEERPTMSMEFIPALRAGRIDVRPGIAGFEGKRVTFSDGSEADADVILYATGYELDFPFLSSSTLGCAAPELGLYQRIAHPHHDDLFFVGCLRVTCSMWPVAEQQSRWIARLLGGAFELPLRAERQRLAPSLARSLPVICNLYVDELRCEAGGL